MVRTHFESASTIPANGIISSLNESVSDRLSGLQGLSPLCCGPARNRQLFSSSLAVLAAPLPLHCAVYDTALLHRRNAAKAVTSDRKCNTC